MLGRLGSALLLCVALFAAPVSAYAQDEPTAPEAEAPAIEAIPTSRVVSAADDVARTTRSYEKAIAPDERTVEIESRISGVEGAIDRQAARQARILEDPSLNALDELESEWQALRGPLPDWRAELSTRVGQIEEMLLDLDEMRSVWQLSEERAREEGAPAAILDRIRATRSSIEEKRARARDRRSALLTLQASVIAEENRTDEALASLENLRGLLVRRVFEQDRDPIWAPALRQRFATDFGARLSAVLERELGELVQFLEAQRERIPLQALAFVVLTVLLRTARVRVRRRTEEEVGLGRVADVFEFPLSMALLLVILMTPWFYAHFPPVVGQILGAAALVPTVRILQRFTAKPLLPLLHALVVFYFVDRVRDLTTALPIFSRSLFILEMLFAVAFLAWLLRPARLVEVSTGEARLPMFRALGHAGRATLLIFSVALVAEILGFSRLGHLLGGAVLESAYFGVVAYAAVRILDSLVTLALRVRPLGLLRMVRRSRYAMHRRIMRGMRILAIVGWAVITLDLFALWTPLFEATREFVAAEITVGALAFSLGDLIAFFVTIGLAILISRFLRFVLEEDVYPRMRLGRGVPYAISTFSHYVILLVGFVLAIAAMGIDLDRFALLAGAFGVGIGFGLQNVVNNFVSGLILLSERPIQVGDTIEAGDTLGEIARIGIRSSTVRTWTGAEMIVPNAQLISERVTNWTLSDRQRRVDVPFGVAYGTDREKVLELMSRVADEAEGVMEHPAPVSLFMGFGDSSLDFELRAWTNELTKIAVVRSQLAMGIGDALEEAGIEIPFPQRDLHLRSVDDAAASRLLAESSED